MVTETQSMLPPASASAPQFVGAQFTDNYPQNYGTSMAGLPYAYDSGGHNSFAMVCLLNGFLVA